MTTEAKAERFGVINPLLGAMVLEFQEATKKKPEATLNERKVAIVNRLLKDVLFVLETEPTRQFLDLLDESDLPQNSDVSLILGQAAAAMKAFHIKYFGDYAMYGHVWATPENLRRR